MVAKSIIIGLVKNENSVKIGAGTFVNKSVPDGATCVGVPGRILEKK